MPVLTHRPPATTSMRPSPSPSTSSSTQTKAMSKLARPRGLWKARETQTQTSHASAYRGGAHGISTGSRQASPHTPTAAPTALPITAILASDYPLRPNHGSHHKRAHAGAQRPFEFGKFDLTSLISDFPESRSYSDHLSPYDHSHDHCEYDYASDSSSSSTSSSSAGSCSYHTRPRKRRRLSASTPATSESCSDLELDEDHSRSKKWAGQSAPIEWTTRSKLMDTSSIGTGAGAGAGLGFGAGMGFGSIPDPAQNPSSAFDLQDWEDLKELSAKAAQMYDTQPPETTLPLLRGVIHECHRFMLAYPDPSTLYTTPPSPPAKSDADTITTHAHTHSHYHHLRDAHNKSEKGKERERERERERAQGAPLPAAVDRPASSAPTTPAPPPPKKCTHPPNTKPKDLPTAFYTVLGSTLFFFGSIIEAYPSLAMDGEPTRGTPYWLSALDVFEIGENLPVRTNGRGGAVRGTQGWGVPAGGGWRGGSGTPPPEDWRMAVVWGRTLVSVAEEVGRRERERRQAGIPEPSQPESPPTFPSAFPTGLPPSPAELEDPDEPNWPAHSPFAAIVARRPPLTCRVKLGSGERPHELLQLAQDQFSRGILHMPHPQHLGPRFRLGLYDGSASPSPSTTASSSSKAPNSGKPSNTSKHHSANNSTFSRAKELYTIASEVLLLAEKLDSATERQTWAQWADSVFSQMKMEGLAADADLEGLVSAARGRCAVVIGSALAEGVEERLERAGRMMGKDGDGGEAEMEMEEEEEVLKSEEARDAREVLGEAIGYLERAKEDFEARRKEKEKDQPEQEAEDEDEDMIVSLEDAENDDEEEEEEEDDDMHPDNTTPTPTSVSRLPALDEMDEIKTLLAEALLSLANLTADKKERERLYERAQEEGGEDLFVLDDADEDVDMDG